MKIGGFTIKSIPARQMTDAEMLRQIRFVSGDQSIDFDEFILLDEILHAAYMVQLCRGPNPTHDVGQQIGELDWVAELHRLLEKEK
jgi:hypothetical protein